MKKIFVVIVFVILVLFGSYEVIKYTRVNEETNIDAEEVENVINNNEDNEESAENFVNDEKETEYVILNDRENDKNVENIEVTMTLESSYGGWRNRWSAFVV